MLINASGATKKDETAFMPWDVFSELQPLEEEYEEVDAVGIQRMIHEMAVRANARLLARGEDN